MKIKLLPLNWNKYNTFDKILIIVQILILVWGFLNNLLTIVATYYSTKSELTTNSFYFNLFTPNIITLGYFIGMTLITKYIINNFSRKKILLCIFSTLIFEFILIEILW